MKVLVVAEYYPRAEDPTSGIWAHRQTVAARRAGAEVRVLVLHRPLPPLAAIRAADLGAVRAAVRQPGRDRRDGVDVEYLRYLSPPRPVSYASWGAWAAPLLRRAMRRIRREFAFDLVHAHYAVPAGDAVRRAQPRAPLVISVHGGDVLGAHAGSPTVAAALGHAPGDGLRRLLGGQFRAGAVAQQEPGAGAGMRPAVPGFRRARLWRTDRGLVHGHHLLSVTPTSARLSTYAR